MKAALNGGLNLSILDGWWDEWYDGDNGWAIPTADGVEDIDKRDDIEAVLTPLREKYPDVTVDSEVRYGVPIESLIEETGTVDLLILGVHSHPVTGVTFGGVVRGVLAHALCPVCLVR